MAEKLDYSNLGFAYHTPEKRYVSNYKGGSWDEGGLSSDSNVGENVSFGGLFGNAELPCRTLPFRIG